MLRLQKTASRLWRQVASVLNKHFQTADNWLLSKLGAGRMAKAFHHENTLRGLTLTLLTCRMWWAPSNASKWQMGFNSAFKGLMLCIPYGLCSSVCCYTGLTAFIATDFCALGKTAVRHSVFVYAFWKSNPNLPLQKTMTLALIEASKWGFLNHTRQLW